MCSSRRYRAASTVGWSMSTIILLNGKEEYESYCLNNGLCICEESAEQFVHHKDEELEKAIENGEA